MTSSSGNGGGGSSGGKATWLPNLVGGVSIWKLGADLNQARFFDGRLLEPEVEGADSLPTRVVWNVDRLVPLHEARTAHGDDVRVAIEALLGCVERVGKELSSSSSGFRKFKDAFSVPSLEGEGEASYFYDPANKKLFVANWGASPRSIFGKGEVVFGYEAFGELLAATRAGLGSGPAKVGGAAAAGAESPAEPPGDATDAAADEKKAEDEKDKLDDGKSRPIWVWILAVLVGIAIIVALLFLLRECREREAGDAADAGPDSALDAGGDADADANADATAADADASAADAGDAGPDADADAGDAGPDADADAGADAGDDAATPEVDAGGEGDGSGETPSGGDGSGNGVIYVVPGGSGPGVGAPPQGAVGIPFRSHFQPGAKSWRLTKGAKILNRGLPPRMNKGSLEVFLEPGASFSQVQVEWKDAAGTWHVH